MNLRTVALCMCRSKEYLLHPIHQTEDRMRHTGHPTGARFSVGARQHSCSISGRHRS